RGDRVAGRARDREDRALARRPDHHARERLLGRLQLALRLGHRGLGLRLGALAGAPGTAAARAAGAADPWVADAAAALAPSLCLAVAAAAPSLAVALPVAGRAAGRGPAR